MEKELNIAAILKGKPTETKLWSPMLGDCIYCYNNTYSEEIIIAFTDKNGEEKEWTFSYSGRTISAPDTAEVCLFPSKQMRDWSKFAWENGDVLLNDDGKFCIFESFAHSSYSTFKSKLIKHEGPFKKVDTFLADTKNWHKASDDVAKEYIAEIEEVEEQPEFKDGDILHCDETDYSVENIFIAKMHGEAIGSYAFLCLHNNKLNIADCDCDESELPAIRLATDSEKQQLFSALEKEGKRWNPDTKKFEDLPKKCEFKPFQKVLAKFDEDCEWMPDFFYYYDKSDSEMPYVCIANGRAIECIPYNEETKHLLGTTDEWKGGEG